MNKVIVITGGSSGIGLCTAKELYKSGEKVYELSRRESNIDGIKHISVDITDFELVKKTIKEIIKEEGHIDVLINNAGFGISGTVEFTEVDEIRKLMEVNFFAITNITKEILTYMREKNCGKIINISSVAADLSIPFQAYYSVSKAAINSFTKALANEVKRFNIIVCGVMPGDIKTGFTKAREKLHKGDEIYNNAISNSVERMEKDEQNGMSPEFAGKFIRKIALKKKNKVLYTIGFKYKIFVAIAHVLPTNFTNKIIGLIYAK